jgi:gamma-glutamylcyclotransferase (GGCT)/AIG2-like uncharacterized protein YtfP
VSDLVTYFAFGSNMSTRQMFNRCPSARPMGTGELRGYHLVFGGRGVASIEPHESRKVHGVLYVMKAADLLQLDTYEGVPTVYRRCFRKVVDKFGTRWKAHTYVLNDAGRSRPAESYLSTIREAYVRFNLPIEPLHRALEDAKPRPVLQVPERMNDEDIRRMMMRVH